jgi:cytochrome c oxidase subunit III
VNILVMFLLIALAGVVWWLLLQKLQVKPWLEQGIALEPANSTSFYPSKVVGLGVFLAVITALFSLFAAAYHMRMSVPDWSHLPLPKLLWLNTALLVLSSIAMQFAWSAADRYALNCALKNSRSLNTMRQGLLVGGCFAVAFLVGQLLAWRQLDSIGFFFACSPASAFFYLLTGLHGAHLLGGLAVWGKTTAKLYRSDFESRTAEINAAQLSIKLCAIYWHYLLLIWLALFALLSLT